jgi:hypothetical protein
MPRKTKTPATPYNPVSEQEAKDVVFATTGTLRDKAVDPTKIIGPVHIKKRLADTNINGDIEKWIEVIRKLTPEVVDGVEQPVPELTPEEALVFEQCKKQVAAYLDTEASQSLKDKIKDCKDELKNLKDVSSSMKFKFSKFAYETITHVINLMVREIVVHTCDNCVAQKAKLTRPSHIPWDVLRTKQLAGLYMNTPVVFEALHPVEEEEDEEEDEVVEEEAVEEEAPEEAVGDDEATEEEAGEDKEDDKKEKQVKPPLYQYVANTFREVLARDERFKGLLFGKPLSVVLDRVVFETLDRFSKVIKSLLETANSKTVNERLALIAIKILLQDHIQSCDDDVRVVLDVVQARLEVLKEAQAHQDEVKKALNEFFALDGKKATSPEVKKAKARLAELGVSDEDVEQAKVDKAARAAKKAEKAE